MPRAFYNDYAKFPCLWMRELISAGHITAGDVVEGDIAKIQPSQLAGYDRIHLFAGIAGWDVALTRAGWPDSVPVMTGSCPCQPFSSANTTENRGIGSERDIWPQMYRLIRATKIPFVFGEQVEDAISYGWVDRLEADLAREGYIVAYAVLGAHSIGAPHKRDRLYWLAYSTSSRREFRQEMGRDLGRKPGTASEPLFVQCGAVGAYPRYSPRETRRILCANGIHRRIPLEPELYPMATGVPGYGMEIVRGAGNAIHTETAAKFVRAVMQAFCDT